MSRLDTFNPNKPPAKIEWATFIPGRSTSPEFKTHKNRGHALNAFQHKSEGIIYHWENQEWIEVCRVDKKDVDNCEKCGNTLWRAYVTGGGDDRGYIYGEEAKKHRHAYKSYTDTWVDRKNLIRLRICYDCERQIRYGNT